MLSNAAWHAIESLGGAVGGAFLLWNTWLTRRAVKSSEGNSDKIEAIHQSVNGAKRQAVSEAVDYGRHNSPPQVLIVDDNPLDLELMARQLKMLDADVFALTGWEAVEQLLRSRTASARGYPFDVVFVDLRMPDDGTIKVLKLCKQHAPGVCRYVITGRARHDMTDDLRDCEPYGFLTKPLTAEIAADVFTQLKIPFRPIKPNAEI